MEQIAKLKGYKPIVYLGNKIVLYKSNNIYTASLNLKKINFICSIRKLNIKDKIISKSRLAQRIFRTDAGIGINLSNLNSFLFSYKGKMYYVDIKKKNIREETVGFKFKKTLQMCNVSFGKYKGSIVFGDYENNKDLGSVFIYRRDHKGTYSKIFTFPKGTIKHIHGIFEDLQNSCFYVLTGDYGNAASIWKVDSAFKNPEVFLRCGQLSRACWIKIYRDSLIYATDSDLQTNYLLQIDKAPNAKPKKLFPISGSSIYYSSAHKNIIFSTSVESDTSFTNSRLALLLSRKRGDGIISDRSCLYMGTLDNGFELIFSGKKDNLPYGLFQFGNIIFPTGTLLNQEYLHFYCTSLTGKDGYAYAYKI